MSNASTSSPLKALSDEGVSIWLDDLSRTRIGPATSPRSSRRATSWVSPRTLDLPGRHRLRRGLRGAARRPGRPQGHRRRGRPHDDDAGRARRRRRPAPRVRRDAGPRRPRLHRGRPAPRPRDRRPRSPRPSSWPGSSTGPTLMIKIPATLAGLPAITEVIGLGISRQRHADLLARRATSAVMDAYLRGPGEGARARHRPRHDPLRRVLLRVARRRRDRQAPRRDRHGRGARPRAARPRSPTPGSPTRPTRAGLRHRAGRDPGGRRANKQRPLWASTGVRTPRTRTPCTSTSSSPRHREHHAGRHPAATADHGDIHGDSVSGTYDASRAEIAAVESSASPTTRSSSSSRTRPSPSSRSPGPTCSAPSRTASREAESK